MRHVLSILLFAVTSLQAALPEPDLVFYGRVLHLGGGEEYLVTSGTLEWRVEPFNSSHYTTFETQTQLAPLNGGTMSYSIRIPNHLVVAGTVGGVEPGLAVLDANGLPFRNTSILINGKPVRLADPDGFSFDVSSEKRSTFKQLDLIMDGSLPDRDGDGLPDWWEEKYGTNGQLADALQDADGDGVSNQAEYLLGTDPVGADQQPRITAETLVSLPLGGAAVPLFRAIDGDSSPSDLTYQLGTLPEGISIELLGPTTYHNPNTFTQEDVDTGRLLVRHSGTQTVDYRIPLTLADETSTHASVATTLRITVSEAATLWEGWGISAETLPEAFPVVQDATRLPNHSTLRTPTSALRSAPAWESGRLLIGSVGADQLKGSAKDDVISAGAGDVITGGLGADRMVFAEGSSGTVTMTDFAMAEQDVIDLRGLLQPVAGRWLSDYVQLQDNVLKVDVNGDGSGSTDLTMKLTGADLPNDAAELWDMGLLKTGSVVPRTTLFLSTSGQASEEGLTPATITLRRRGSVDEALSVAVAWSGTATLGLDFASVSTVAYFARGEKFTSFTIQPLADALRETPETVQIELSSGDEWVIADGHRTITMSIMDVPSRVWLEVTERVAYVDSLSPGQIFVRRSGPLNAPLSVKLATSGRATANLDYRRLPASVTFDPSQDVIALELMPLSGATLSNDAEDVRIAIEPDTAYLFGGTAETQVVVIKKPRTIAGWMTEHGLAVANLQFLEVDADRDGMSGLVEFAFNGNPMEAEGWELRGLMNAAGLPGIEYRRWPGAPELRYVLQRSNDMTSWADVSSIALQETGNEILENGMELVQVFLHDQPSEDAFYLRVDVRRSN